MKTEKIKTYCIVGMDNVKGLDTDIQSISVAPATLIVGVKQVGLVGVFQSKLDPDRIKEVLNIGGDRSFFVSELNPSTFSAHIDMPDVHEIFFGEFDRHQKQYTRIKSKLEDFISTGFTDNSVIENDIEYNEKQLSALSEDQRSLLMDKLLTNVTELTDNQKKALNFLASL